MQDFFSLTGCRILFSESPIPSIKSQIVGSYTPVYWVTNLPFLNLPLTGMHNISQNLLKLVPGSQMVRMTRTSERQAKIWHSPLPSQLFPWGSGPVSCPRMVKLYLKTDLQYFKSRKLFLKEALLKAKYDCQDLRVFTHLTCDWSSPCFHQIFKAPPHLSVWNVS